jgi:hypothetical protein
MYDTNIVRDSAQDSVMNARGNSLFHGVVNQTLFCSRSLMYNHKVHPSCKLQNVVVGKPVISFYLATREWGGGEVVQECPLLFRMQKTWPH